MQPRGLVAEGLALRVLESWRGPERGVPGSFRSLGLTAGDTPSHSHIPGDFWCPRRFDLRGAELCSIQNDTPDQASEKHQGSSPPRVTEPLHVLERPLELDHPNPTLLLGGPGVSQRVSLLSRGSGASSSSLQGLHPGHKRVPSTALHHCLRGPHLTVQPKLSNSPTLLSPDAHLPCLYNTNHSLRWHCRSTGWHLPSLEGGPRRPGLSNSPAALSTSQAHKLSRGHNLQQDCFYECLQFCIICHQLSWLG